MRPRAVRPADMRRMTSPARACAAALLALTWASSAAAQSATARTVRFEATALGGQATFAVLLPPDYETSGRRYPVVYLLHGGTQTHTAFPSRSWFAREVLRRNVIAVMPHIPQFAYGMRGGTMPFESFVVDDLVAYVDANYRTIRSRDARAIGGLSMGGFGATLAALRHPEVFAMAGAFSGAFAGDRVPLLGEAIAALEAKEAPFLYLACGIQDPILQASRDLVALLAARDIPHEYREVPGAHTWDVWDPQTLAFLDVISRHPGFGASPR